MRPQQGIPAVLVTLYFPLPHTALAASRSAGPVCTAEAVQTDVVAER